MSLDQTNPSAAARGDKIVMQPFAILLGTVDTVAANVTYYA